MKYFFVLALLYSAPGHSTITNFSVGSGTYSNIITENSSQYIFGGIAGTCTGTATTTCDSCDGSGVTACNTARIHSGLNLTISFQSSESGQACLMTTGTSPTALAGPIAYTAGNTVTLTLNWGTICNNIISDSTCPSTNTSATQATYEIGIDKDGSCVTLDDKQSIFVVVAGLPDASSSSELSSIADFEAYPGDEKVYMRNIESYLGTDQAYSPERGPADIASVGAFYLEDDGACGSYASIVNNSPSYFTAVSASGELTDNRIRNLVNDKYYVLRMAAKDEANNIGFFTAVACDPTVHVAYTDDVYGLLEDEKNCFIATAAFGSILDPHVQTFRDFRDQYLKASTLGKKFVKLYYKNSPPLAEFISQHEYLRAGARILLFPLWGLAWMYLNMGALAANLVLVVMIGSFIVAVKIFRQKRATT